MNILAYFMVFIFLFHFSISLSTSERQIFSEHGTNGIWSRRASIVTKKGVAQGSYFQNCVGFFLYFLPFSHLFLYLFKVPPFSLMIINLFRNICSLFKFFKHDNCVWPWTLFIAYISQYTISRSSVQSSKPDIYKELICNINCCK